MKKSIAIFLLASFLLAACSEMVKPVENDGIRVSVSIPPQAWLVQRIAGDLVEVQSLTQPGDDPHTYEPSPQQMAALAGSDLYFSIGVEFEEAWLPRLANNNRAMKTVDITHGIQWLDMDHEHAAEGYEVHEDHAEEQDDAASDATALPHDHAHGKDPHIWLSLPNLRLLASNTAQALIAFNPPNQAQYQANLQTLLQEISAAQTEMDRLLGDKAGKHFLIIHPALGYLAHDYALEQIPVETGGQEPGPESLAGLISTARDLGIQAIFVQRGVDPKMANAIASQLKIDTLHEVDPLAENVLDNLSRIGPVLAEALR